MATPRILVIDRDERAAALAAHALRRDGFEVVLASRNEDALALFCEKPAMVFCDVDLADGDGFKICEWARRETAVQHIPFVLLSRIDDADRRERSRRAGADDLLFKPLFVRDLRTIARLFAGRRTGERIADGDLASIPLLFLLRALTGGIRSGEIELPAERAAIWFREGRVVDAFAGELTREAGLARLLVLARGPFLLKLGPVLRRETMSYTLKDLVTQDAPRRERFERALALLGGPVAILETDLNALARELPNLPPSIARIVRLFDGSRGLADALRAAELEELTAVEAVVRLRMLGVLRPGLDLAPPLSSPRPAPAVFEPRSESAERQMRELFADLEPLLEADTSPAGPVEVRDWFEEFARRDGLHEVMGADEADGGWQARPASEAVPTQLTAARVVPVAAAPVATAARAALAAEPPESAAAPAPEAPKESAAAEPAREAPASTPAPAPAPARDEPHEQAFFASEPKDDANKPFEPPGLGPIYLVFAVIALVAGLFLWAVKPAKPRSRELPTLPPAAAKKISNEAPAAPSAETVAKPVPVAAKANLGDIDKLIAKGRILYDQHRPEEALVPLEEVARMVPNDSNVQLLLSLARLDAGLTSGALESAERAIQLNPRASRAHLVIGTVYRERGELPKARAAFEAYLELAPKGPFAGDVRAILRDLK